MPVAGARPDAALLRRRLDQCTLLERERERERREKKEREEDPTFLFFDPTLSHPSRDPPPGEKKNVSSADKQTFPALDLVGWYAVGPLSQPPGGAGTTAAAVHDALSPAEGSEAAAPFGLVFDPTALLLPGGGLLRPRRRTRRPFLCSLSLALSCLRSHVGRGAAHQALGVGPRGGRGRL